MILILSIMLSGGGDGLKKHVKCDVFHVVRGRGICSNIFQCSEARRNTPLVCRLKLEVGNVQYYLASIRNHIFKRPHKSQSCPISSILPKSNKPAKTANPSSPWNPLSSLMVCPTPKISKLPVNSKQLSGKTERFRPRLQYSKVLSTLD